MKSKVKEFIKKIPKVLHYKRLWLLLLLPAALALYLLARASSDFAEFYAVNIYKYIAKAWSFVSSLIPFSVVEVLLALLIVGGLVYLVFAAVWIVRRRGKRLREACKLAMNLLCAVSVVIFLFVTNCGMNYYRYTFSQEIGLETGEYTSDQLYDLCVFLAEKINETRTEMGGDDALELSDFSDISDRATEALNSLEDLYPTVWSGFNSVKPVMLSELMCYTKITGVFSPFTFEANVNYAVPDYTLPVTMCHELAHLRGYMREYEANFIAFLACVNSDSAELRYSGYMLAFTYAMNTFGSDDRRYDIYASLCDGAMSDLNYSSEFWAQYSTPVAQAASAVNNAYLKANNQTGGTKSYGGIVDLLLAYYDT